MTDITDSALTKYENLVKSKHASKIYTWPIITGCDFSHGMSGMYYVLIAKDTGKKSIILTDIIDTPKMLYLAGGTPITDATRESARSSIRQRMALGPRDAVFLFRNNQPLPEGSPNNIPLFISNDSFNHELQQAMKQHEIALGLAPMKIFLSHKGADKALIREYKQTLQLLGFSPWLDEDAMPAGTSLERGILKGFEESCAVVFFVTPNFKDEKYLETEVDYAIAQRRTKGDNFSIITLVLEEKGLKGTVPQLLRPFVWKEPTNHLQGLREILQALPIRVGEVRYKP
jgi:hypothetical protein